MVRPFPTDVASGFRRPDRIVADFSMTLRMRVDARTEVAGHHLRTKADSEIRLLVAQRHTDPVDLPMHKLLVVIGTLRTPEDNCAGMVIHCLRQRVAKAGASDVERMAKPRQRLADSAG